MNIVLYRMERNGIFCCCFSLRYNNAARPALWEYPDENEVSVHDWVCVFCVPLWCSLENTIAFVRSLGRDSCLAACVCAFYTGTGTVVVCFCCPSPAPNSTPGFYTTVHIGNGIGPLQITGITNRRDERRYRGAFQTGVKSHNINHRNGTLPLVLDWRTNSHR